MKLKIWRALAIGVLVSLCAFDIAQAAGTSATVRWTIATQYTNGSALVATDIKETLIEWRIKGQSALAGSVRVAAPAVTTVVDLGGASCGAFNFVAKTVLKDAAVSAASATVPYDTGVSCLPNPPAAVTAT
jgi:hypothetical protein